MTDPGLNDRLRQKSRRAGLAVGLTMVLTIAVCVGAAAAIYAALIRPFSDLIPIEAPRPVPAATTGGDSARQSAQVTIDTAAPAPPADAAAPPPVPPPTPPPAPNVEPTATPEAFTPTHQIAAQGSVNLRPRPSAENTADNVPIRALPPATPLQYLDEDQPTDNPNDAPRWMRFRTEQGEEGWIREIDVEAYDPGA